MKENGNENTRRRAPFFLFVTALNSLGCILTMFLMVVIMIDVCGRVFFSSPLTGTTELVIAMITVIAFLQMTYVQMENGHLRVTIFADKFPQKVQNGLYVFGLFFGIAVFVLMTWSAYTNLMTSIATHETEGEGALVLPMWPVRFVILFCSVVMILVMMKQIVDTFRKKRRDAK